VLFAEDRFSESGVLLQDLHLPAVAFDTGLYYENHVLAFFCEHCLSGMHIGIYEHSSVSRNCLQNMWLQRGAKLTSLARSDDGWQSAGKSVSGQTVVLFYRKSLLIMMI